MTDHRTPLALPTLTRAQAMAGKAGVDYLPDSACRVCGAVPWWNGKTFVDEHDDSKHGVNRAVTGEGRDARRVAGEGLDSAAQAIERALTNARNVRRSTGERDDDD